MKFNWGHGIVGVLVLFGALIFTLVYKSHQQNIDLVTEEYYDTEGQYQERQIRKSRAKDLDGEFLVERTNEGFEVTLPEGLDAELIEGTITFYNPTDKLLDFEIPLSKGMHIQSHTIDPLAGGRWTVKVDIPGEEGFFFESNVYL